MTGFRQTVREALSLLIVGTILGFGYTALTKKGLFEVVLPIEPQSPHANFQIIQSNEAREIFYSGKATFIDARHAFDFKLGHIARAINIPLNEFNQKRELLAAYSKDQLLVVYCDGAECNSSLEVSMKLDSLGYVNVKDFFGGWNEWQSMQLPTEQ